MFQEQETKLVTESPNTAVVTATEIADLCKLLIPTPKTVMEELDDFVASITPQSRGYFPSQRHFSPGSNLIQSQVCNVNTPLIQPGNPDYNFTPPFMPKNYEELVKEAGMYSVCLDLFRYLPGITPWEWCHEYIEHLQRKRTPLTCNGAMLLWLLLAAKKKNFEQRQWLLDDHYWTQATVDRHLDNHLNESYVVALLQFESQRLGMLQVCTEAVDWLKGHSAGLKNQPNVWVLWYRLVAYHRRKDMTLEKIKVNVLLLWCYVATRNLSKSQDILVGGRDTEGWYGLPWTQEKVNQYLHEERDLPDLVDYELQRRGIKIIFLTSQLDYYALNSLLALAESEAYLLNRLPDGKLYQSILDWFSVDIKKPPSELEYWHQKSLLRESLFSLLIQNLQKYQYPEAVAQIYRDQESKLNDRIHAAQIQTLASKAPRNYQSQQRPSEIWMELYRQLKNGKDILDSKNNKRQQRPFAERNRSTRRPKFS